ncbi:MAG: cupin domain-containing protein [Actinomycetota bacterium]|nr:cupin domain-containing protein [Actinomycetota bacterium]
MAAFEDLAAIPPQGIWDRIAARSRNGRELTLSVVELDPGAVVAEHRHPNEQLGIVVRGSMDFRVGEERRELGPGGTWLIPADTPHAATAGPDGAVVIDVFSPPRDDWKALEPEQPRQPRWP